MIHQSLAPIGRLGMQRQRSRSRAAFNLLVILAAALSFGALILYSLLRLAGVHP